MKKIAWCLYGQPRFLLEGYNTIKNFIKNHNVDFYYHTWILNDGESYDYSYKKFDFGTVKVTIDDINVLYKPKAYKAEPQIKFNHYDDIRVVNSINYKNTNWDNPDKDRRINNGLSCHYSKQQVYDLLYNTIINDKINYDGVIISRFDLKNKINLDLNNINFNKINISNMFFLYRPIVMCDHMIITNVENFFKLFNIFNNLYMLINNKEINNIFIKYNENYNMVAETLLQASYFYHFKDDLSHLEYINIPNFR